MRNINKSEALQIIEKYTPIIKEAVSKGFQHYVQQVKPTLTPITKRTSAGLIRDIIVFELKKHKSPGFEVYTKNGNLEDLELVLLDSKLALRFKKLDDEKRARNNATKQTRDFLNQNYEIDFLDVHPTCCDLGYKLNRFGNILEFVTIVCRLNNTVMWEYNIPIDSTVKTSSQGHLFNEENVTRPKRIALKNTPKASNN